MSGNAGNLMFEKLKLRSIQKRKEKDLRERDRSQVNASMTTLGFLVDESVVQDFESLYDFSKEFGLQRKDVKLFSFIEVKRKTPSLRQNQINNKDFSWKGEIGNQNAREFLEIPFDVLVCLHAPNNEFIEMMAARSKAKFKVSTTQADDRLFDLLLGVDPSKLGDLRAELKKYLTILKKI